MPWGLHRRYRTGHLHFVTFSCYHRRPFLSRVRRRDLFLQILEQVRRRYHFIDRSGNVEGRMMAGEPVVRGRSVRPVGTVPLFPGENHMPGLGAARDGQRLFVG